MAKGAFPSTPMDEYTPEAWAVALEDDRFEDALVVLKDLMREQTFIHVSDIAQSIARLRNKRILDFGILPPPPAELADDPAGEMVWRRAVIKRIADGDAVDLPRELEAPSVDHAKKRDAVLESLRFSAEVST